MSEKSWNPFVKLFGRRTDTKSPDQPDPQDPNEGYPYRSIDGETRDILEREKNNFKLSETVTNSEHGRVNETVELNLVDTLNQSKKLYQQFNLPTFADALPSNLQIDQPIPDRQNQTAREVIKQAMRGEYGGIVFDKAMIIPSVATQEPEDSDPNIKEQKRQQVLTDLRTNLVDNNKLANDVDPYYNEKALQNPLSEPAKKLRQKAYLVLYSSDPIPCKGLTFPQAQAEFTQNNWNGLTLPEFLILQAQEQNSSHNHDFIAYDSNNAQKSNWSWLLDTAVGSSDCVDAGWYPGYRRVRVDWYDSGDCHDRLGARSAVVVPIEI